MLIVLGATYNWCPFDPIWSRTVGSKLVVLQYVSHWESYKHLAISEDASDYLVYRVQDSMKFWHF